MWVLILMSWWDGFHMTSVPNFRSKDLCENAKTAIISQKSIKERIDFAGCFPLTDQDSW